MGFCLLYGGARLSWHQKGLWVNPATKRVVGRDAEAYTSRVFSVKTPVMNHSPGRMHRVGTE